jgi:hypothetical protein
MIIYFRDKRQVPIKIQSSRRQETLTRHTPPHLRGKLWGFQG